MKTLQDYINEHAEVNIDTINESEAKSFTFDFAGLDNAEDTLKSLENLEYCTVEDTKVTIEANEANCTKLSTVQDILQQYYETERKSQHHTSNESYAQKVKAFGTKLDEFNDTLDCLQNPDEEE